ncbi:MAG: hypothetical protein AB7F86_16785 [Bdellovibrionales bacterium]
MSRVVLGARDRDMLHFLWQFKFAPTSLVAARCYQGSSQWAVYQRLHQLSQAGLVKSLFPESGGDHFWRLAEKGYIIVAGELPALVQGGFGSENIRHDYLVTVAHLGAWLKATPPSVRLFTEQELRRIDPENYPAGIPKAQNHRPDGYWLFRKDESPELVALEIELSQKAWDVYDTFARFYYEDAMVSQVLWIVKNADTAKRMHERFRKAIPDGFHVHSFIVLSEFLRSIWQARITVGKDRGQTIVTVLQNMSRTSPEHVLDFDFFDTRKNPKDSIAKLKREPALGFN